MNWGKVRTIHRRLGITIVPFLLVQAMLGALMSMEKLAALENSKPYNILYTIHADWGPLGSIYRVILGLATCLQGFLGIMIFLKRIRMKSGSKVVSSIPLSLDKPHELKKDFPEGALSFATDIRPLFRDKDIEAMKPNGIDLSSYDDVKKRAQEIYARLAAKEMPCDGSWRDSQVRKFKEWMQSGMEP